MTKNLLLFVFWAFISWVPGYVQAQNRPDLVVTAPFTTPASVVAGGTAYMAADIRNQGTNGAQFNCIGYYLSTDATWDATDAYLGASCQGLLFPGQSGTCSITGRIPLVPAGSYRLVLVADPLNAEQESDETNNVVSLPITVTAGPVALPDLELWRPSLSFSSLPAGGSTGVFSFIYNRGPAAAPAHEIGFYLSTDTIFSAGTDVLLGNITNGGLSGVSGSGGTGVGTVFSAPVLPVPALTSPGNYYLVIMIDPRNLVVESNESNNSRALPLRVTGSVTAVTSAAATGVEVYPNPVKRGEQLHIQLPHMAERPLGSLTDALGRPVTGVPVVVGETGATIDTRNVPAGMYLLHLRGAEFYLVRRLVVE